MHWQQSSTATSVFRTPSRLLDSCDFRLYTGLYSADSIGCSCMLHSFNHSFSQSIIHSFIHSFILSFIHSFIHSFQHYFRPQGFIPTQNGTKEKLKTGARGQGYAQTLYGNGIFLPTEVNCFSAFVLLYKPCRKKNVSFPSLKPLSMGMQTTNLTKMYSMAPPFIWWLGAASGSVGSKGQLPSAFMLKLPVCAWHCLRLQYLSFWNCKVCIVLRDVFN